MHYNLPKSNIGENSQIEKETSTNILILYLLLFKKVSLANRWYHLSKAFVPMTSTILSSQHSSLILIFSPFQCCYPWKWVLKLEKWVARLEKFSSEILAWILIGRTNQTAHNLFQQGRKTSKHQKNRGVNERDTEQEEEDEKLISKSISIWITNSSLVGPRNEFN